MRHIMVMNAKGGCGKSTLATNLASYYAGEGYAVALADFDPQRSSLDWAALRPPEYPAVHAIAAYEDGLRSLPRNADYVIIDAPPARMARNSPSSSGVRRASSCRCSRRRST